MAPPSKKKGNVDDRSGASRRKKKAAKAAPEKSSSEGQAKNEEADPFVKLTRQETRGVESPARFTDGLHMFLRLPIEIRSERIKLSEVVEAMLAGPVREPSEVQRTSASDSKGWVVKMRSQDVVERVAGHQFILKGYKVSLSPYANGGYCVFVSDRTNARGAEELIQAITMSSHIRGKAPTFWLGQEEYRSIRGDTTVLVFPKPPGFLSLDVPLGEPTRGYSHPFRLKFRAGDLSERHCSVCGEADANHGVVHCPTLQTVKAPAGMDLGGCSLLDACPPLPGNSS